VLVDEAWELEGLHKWDLIAFDVLAVDMKSGAILVVPLDPVQDRALTVLEVHVECQTHR